MTQVITIPVPTIKLLAQQLLAISRQTLFIINASWTDYKHDHPANIPSQFLVKWLQDANFEMNFD